ncbi:MAG: metallophosphoesterase [Bacteroidetes bacterium]|jgi:predicted MPP superfamily phosphohydrolase|nr:metallophosphoesterase [Bacteroidota bacterium]
MLRILIFTGVILLLDWYVFQAIRLVTRDLSLPTTRVVYFIYWSITAITLLIIFSSTLTDWHSWPKVVRVYSFAFIVLFFISKLFVLIFLLADDLGRAVRWGYSYFQNHNSATLVTATSEPAAGISRSQFIVRLGLFISAIPFLSLIYGMVKGKYDYQIKRRKIRIKNLPKEFEGFKIAQISDIHTGSFFDTQPTKDAVALVNSLNADVIFFTGDLVNDRSDEAVPHMDNLKQLTAPYGVYSILGNHDYGDYVSWPSVQAKADNLQQLKDIHKQLGWKLLLDEHTFIERNNQRMGIIGVQNWSTHLHFPKYGNLQKAIQGMDFAPVNVLLSHDPSHWRAEVLNYQKDIHLTLSGHTHGFQFGVEIPALKFKWSPVQYVYKEWADLYSGNANQFLYVNRGLGYLGYPGRVGILPEITLLELTKA